MIAQFQDWMMTLCLFMEQLISGYFFYDSRMRPPGAGPFQRQNSRHRVSAE